MVAAQRVTRDDIETKLRELRGEVDNARASATSYALVVGGVAVVTVVGIAFLIGRRRGKKKSTVVEIRRI